MISHLRRYAPRLRNVAITSVFLASLGCHQEEGPVVRSECPTNGVIRCLDTTSVEICEENQWRRSQCPQDSVCVAEKADQVGVCREKVCTPGETLSCLSLTAESRCNASGTAIESYTCEKGAYCHSGKCQRERCHIGEKRCYDNKTVEVCNDNEIWEKGELCREGNICDKGECKDLCRTDNKVASYVGCEYWSVDLPNYDNAISQPYAVVVSNINQSVAADITFYEGATDREITNGLYFANNGTFITRPFKKTLVPGEIGIYSFPLGTDHSGTALYHNKAIRLKSNVPVIAYQYNPLNNVAVYSNDGTVLLPTNAVGKEYYALSWTFRKGDLLRGYLTIINSSNAPANVAITASAEILAGEGIGTIGKGETRRLTMAPGDSLNLETSGSEYEAATHGGCIPNTATIPLSLTPCPDLTGTHIVSDQKITVFGGHMCANILPGIDRCDHIESILIPVSSWGRAAAHDPLLEPAVKPEGTLYVAAKFSPRATSSPVEPDIFRIIAAENDTTIYTSPPIAGINGSVLQKGEWKEFEARENFVMKSTKPTMMAQYMVGSNWLGIPRECDQGDDRLRPTGIGDPAMSLVVPQVQWRKEYSVLTPMNYTRDYLNVVAPTGTTVTLDGEKIAPEKWSTVGSSKAYSVAVLQVAAGNHVLRGSRPFGVTSYGYACHVSYATPGGMNVEEIYHVLP